VKYRVVHTTRYRYSSPASLCYNQIHLAARETSGQRIIGSEITIDPRPDDLSERLDTHGNSITYFTIERPHESLVVTATTEFDVDPYDISPAAQRTWESTRDTVIEAIPSREFLLESPFVPSLPEVEEYARPSFSPGRPLIDAVSDLTSRIFSDFIFDPGFTTVSTPLSDVLAHRRGVCQDFAHLAVGCLRSVGLAARYVSGYIETLPPPGEEKLIGADASHAWCSVRLADGSWLDLDPTNDAVGPDWYLTLAWGRDYSEVVPVKGVVMSTGAGMALSVGVDVKRIEEPLDWSTNSQTQGMESFPTQPTQIQQQRQIHRGS
jgi:transglutaminase-like putative cysteine protease